MPFNEFQPPESNFTIANIAKGEKQYLVQLVKDASHNICGSEETFYEFPMASMNETSVILHPCNVWGFPIPSDKKTFIGRQIVQAVTHLHNWKLPILHRDIKLANVLVANESYVTKLCDMGLGKIKYAQTTSHVTSTNIAGTPNYMSPECLVEKVGATTKADVWSLACTLVELFTGKDCWGQIEDEFADVSEDSSYAICRCLKAKELLCAFQYLLPENENLKAMLMRCFNYNAEKRPDAIRILDYL